MCNSSVALIFYNVVQCNNYLHVMFLTWQTSDMSCRWRAYFSYISPISISYSYFMQTLSRFFFTILAAKYPTLITKKIHWTLIMINWIIAILMPLGSLVTEVVRFIPNAFCWIPLEATVHIAPSIFGHYVFPVLAAVGMYIFIYYRMKRSRETVRNYANSRNNSQMEMRVLRNILITVGIFLITGIPNVILIFTKMNLFYIITILAWPFGTAAVQICTIFLDRELYKVVRTMFVSRRSPLPSERA
ncbi:unnamed protein product [Adineta ricciae]|nr:unnamed protein product [Adineta ricciae]